MYDKVANDASVYTNVQGLDQLRADVKNNPKAAKKEVSQQFEAILVQMMLRSMRDANKSFSSDLLNNDQMDFYQDLFDKQLSIALSSRGIGIAGAIEKNIDEHHLAPTADEAPVETSPVLTLPERIQPPQTLIANTPQAPVVTAQPPPATEPAFDSQESFIKHLWPTAKFAAKIIGVSPEVLIAQAALETNWGKKILPHNESTSSFNLFNIKAGSNWAQKTTTMDSLEQKNGVLVKEKSSFRSYESFKESFMDYIHLLQQNSRYKDALNKATDPQQFVHALQNAGYATDSNYANKILKIFDSRSFQNVIAKMQ
jgi:flagellar protein FlgJ